MVENQDKIVKLLEKKVILLIKDIDIQREKEYMQIKNLEKEIRNFYNNYYSHNDKFYGNELVKKIAILENSCRLLSIKSTFR